MPDRPRFRCANGHLIVSNHGLRVCTAAVLADGSPDLYFRGPDTAPRLCGAEIIEGPLVYNDDDELVPLNDGKTT